MRTHASKGSFAAEIRAAVLLVLAVVAIAAGSSPAAAAVGSAAEYSFDAGSGKTLADVSGNGNNGTLDGPVWTSGHTGGGLRFDGVNDLVTVPDTSSLDAASAVTIEAWVRPEGDGGIYDTIALKERPGGLVYALYADGPAGPGGHIYTNGSEPRANGPTRLPEGSWTHLAFTYDGTAIRLYANGTLAATTAASGAILRSDEPLRIGGNTIWSEWFDGTIDDLRIYTRALTAPEIAIDMNTPVTGATAPGDLLPPSTPTAVRSTAVTTSSISLTWTASIDNVGVAGYGVYTGAAAPASTASTSYTVSDLSCGTTYTLSIDAYDAAGNRSAKTSVSASTANCPSPPPSGSGQANVWVDVSGGSCVRQQTPGGYVDGQACGSLQAAWDVARAGDVVNVVDGTYGSQGLAAGSKAVVFRAAGPGRPSFGQIVSAASNLTISGVLIENRGGFDGPCSDPDNAVLYPCGDDQTFENVIVDGLNGRDKHGIRGVGNGFVLRNSEVRNVVDQKGFEGGADEMLIENTYWHAIKVVTVGVHNECMYVDGGNRAVIRGNRFIGCPTMALFFTNWNGGPPYRDVLVENNVFGHTLDASQNWHSGSCALWLGTGANNQNTFLGWTIRYNTFEGCVGSFGTPAAGDTGAGQWYGNLGGIGGCVPEFVYRYNVGQTCGGTGDLIINPAINDAAHPNQAPFYTNAPANDFHLKPGAAAIDKGDRKHFPRADRTGKRRPVGRAPDAGAYEYGRARRGPRPRA